MSWLLFRFLSFKGAYLGFLCIQCDKECYKRVIVFFLAGCTVTCNIKTVSKTHIDDKKECKDERHWYTGMLAHTEVCCLHGSAWLTAGIGVHVDRTQSCNQACGILLRQANVSIKAALSYTSSLYPSFQYLILTQAF